MSETKIKVPEEMRKAAIEGLHEWWKLRGPVNEENAAEIVLEYALLWQKENPPVPTDQDVIEIRKTVADEDYLNNPKHFCVKWICRMYDEPEVEPLVMYIMRHFEPSSKDEKLLRNRAEAAVSDYREHMKRIPGGSYADHQFSGFVDDKPYQINDPEEIKDLLLPDIESGFFKPEILNERLAEAFRRGQKAGPK